MIFYLKNGGTLVLPDGVPHEVIYSEPKIDGQGDTHALNAHRSGVVKLSLACDRVARKWIDLRQEWLGVKAAP